MRAVMVALVGATGVFAVPLSATAVPVIRDGLVVNRVESVAPVAGCPSGSHWVPAGYAKHDKWRPAHLFPELSQFFLPLHRSHVRSTII